MRAGGRGSSARGRKLRRARGSRKRQATTPPPPRCRQLDEGNAVADRKTATAGNCRQSQSFQVAGAGRLDSSRLLCAVNCFACRTIISNWVCAPACWLLSATPPGRISTARKCISPRSGRTSKRPDGIGIRSAPRAAYGTAGQRESEGKPSAAAVPALTRWRRAVAALARRTLPAGRLTGELSALRRELANLRDDFSRLERRADSLAGERDAILEDLQRLWRDSTPVEQQRRSAEREPRAAVVDPAARLKAVDGALKRAQVEKNAIEVRPAERDAELAQLQSEREQASSEFTGFDERLSAAEREVPGSRDRLRHWRRSWQLSAVSWIRHKVGMSNSLARWRSGSNSSRRRLSRRAAHARSWKLRETRRKPATSTWSSSVRTSAGTGRTPGPTGRTGVAARGAAQAATATARLGGRTRTAARSTRARARDAGRKQSLTRRAA